MLRLLPALPKEVFKLSRLAPNRNCVRRLDAVGPCAIGVVDCVGLA